MRCIARLHRERSERSRSPPPHRPASSLYRIHLSVSRPRPRPRRAAPQNRFELAVARRPRKAMTATAMMTRMRTHLRSEKRVEKNDAPGRPRLGGGFFCGRRGVSQASREREVQRAHRAGRRRVVGDCRRRWSRSEMVDEVRALRERARRTVRGRDRDDVVCVCACDERVSIGRPQGGGGGERTADVAGQGREAEERLARELDALDGEARRPLVPLGVLDAELCAGETASASPRAREGGKGAGRTSRSLPLM